MKVNKKIEGRMMPHSIEGEQSVLGCVLIDVDAGFNILSALNEGDFYVEAHKIIFNAMYEIYKKNSPVDLITLSDELEKKDLLESVLYMKDTYENICRKIRKNKVSITNLYGINGKIERFS